MPAGVDMGLGWVNSFHVQVTHPVTGSHRLVFSWSFPPVLLSPVQSREYSPCRPYAISYNTRPGRVSLQFSDPKYSRPLVGYSTVRTASHARQNVPKGTYIFAVQILRHGGCTFSTIQCNVSATAFFLHIIRCSLLYCHSSRT